MKVRALAGISGPMGQKVLGDEFDVADELGADLLKRGLVEAAEPSAVAPKTAKPKPAAGQ